MIQPDAKCVVNGSKVNEVVDALNPLLKMSIEYIEADQQPQISYSENEVKFLIPRPATVGFTEELFDVVESGNTAGTRYFHTSAVSGGDTETTPATSNTSTGQRTSTTSNPERNSLNGTSNSQNRDQLTISANVGTTTGGSAMPLAPGEGGGNRLGNFNDRPADDFGGGGAAMPRAPGPGGGGGGGNFNDRPADDKGGGGKRKEKVKVKPGGGGGSTTTNVPGGDTTSTPSRERSSDDDKRQQKRDAMEDWKRRRKEEMNPNEDNDVSVGTDTTGGVDPVAPPEPEKNYPPPKVGGRPPNQPGGTENTTSPASSPKQSSYAADYTADDIDKFIRGRGKDPDTMSQAEKDSIMQSMNQGRGTVSRRNTSR